MSRTMTAARLQTIGEGLQRLVGVVDQFIESIGSTVGNTRTTTQEIFANWHGPRAEAEYKRADTYFDLVEQVPQAIVAQRDLVTKAANFATEHAPELQRVESWLDSTRRLLDSPNLDDGAASALIDDERAAVSAIGTISATWTRKCNDWFGEQFATGLQALQSAADAVVTDYEGPPIPTSPEAYFGRIAVVVGNDGWDYNWDDFGPAGQLAAAWARGATHVAMDGEFGNLIARTFDTGHAQDDDWDQNVERHDVESLTNPDVAAMQIRTTAASLGYRLDEATVQALVPVLVSQAWLTLSNWSDDTEADLEERLAAWEQNPGPRPSEDALADASVLDVSVAAGDSDDPLGALSLVADGAGAVASMLPGQMAAEAAAIGRSADGVSLVIIGASVIGECADGDNCVVSVVTGAADASLSLAFPVAWPMLKFSGWGILNAVGGMMDQSPDNDANWEGMNVAPGVEPYEQAQGGGSDIPPAAPNMSNENGMLDYGGPPACEDVMMDRDCD